jgi:hypothetical protein
VTVNVGTSDSISVRFAVQVRREQTASVIGIVRAYPVEPASAE